MRPNGPYWAEAELLSNTASPTASSPVLVGPIVVPLWTEIESFVCMIWVRTVDEAALLRRLKPTKQGCFVCGEGNPGPCRSGRRDNRLAVGRHGRVQAGEKALE